MPPILGYFNVDFTLRAIIWHVLMVTVLSNIGKCFVVFCYRKSKPFSQRLAVAISMFPRGEVGAGILVLTLAYGLGGPAVAVAMLSLCLNLILTGVFILMVKKLCLQEPSQESS